jgi:hypothetical protein
MEETGGVKIVEECRAGDKEMSFLLVITFCAFFFSGSTAR